MPMGFRRSRVLPRPLPPLADRFGIRSPAQLARDLVEVVVGVLDRSRFQLDLRSIGLLRPDLSLPAYAAFVPDDGLAPVYNLFDRVGGGSWYSQRVSRKRARDFRGGRLSYDEHDGTDFVCPIGTPLCAAAPGTVVMIRDRWLRGGLTVAVDHGEGVVTQYTHCSQALVPVGEAVVRGQPVALSGAAGLDLVQFFPWIPPHIHFMVYIDGCPVDPFIAPGDSPRPGTWAHGNTPRPSGPLPGDRTRPRPSPVDEARIAEIAAACTDDDIAAEIEACAGVLPRLAALLEDALAHDAWAWPRSYVGRTVRPDPTPERLEQASRVRITLPLPEGSYRGVRFADTWYTRTR
jgi:murein DD-endopeptidase MepM/ murein hydrolase activator NlpD